MLIHIVCILNLDVIQAKLKAKLNMKYLSILLLLLFTSSAIAGSTQTNTSGSNTAIEGGYTSTATTTYQTGSSSNSTTTNNSTSNTKSAPPSASSPSYNSMTQDVCAVGGSLGVQTFGSVSYTHLTLPTIYSV